MARERFDSCASVADAVRLVRDTPVTNGAILTLADASGDRAVVERSCGASRVRRADGDEPLVSFNKYKHPEMERFEVPLGAVSTGLIAGIPLHESDVERQRRWDVLARTASPCMDDRQIHALMSDHAGRAGDKNTICRHGDELSETLWGALIDCERRVLKVVFGHTCSGSYSEYAIDQRSSAAAPDEGSMRDASRLPREHQNVA